MFDFNYFLIVCSKRQKNFPCFFIKHFQGMNCLLTRLRLLLISSVTKARVKSKEKFPETNSHARGRFHKKIAQHHVITWGGVLILSVKIKCSSNSNYKNAGQWKARKQFSFIHFFEMVKIFQIFFIAMTTITNTGCSLQECSAHK
jgi:fucose permease